MALIKLGVPFDVAHAMTALEGLAYRIIGGELEDGKFDWAAMEWERPRE